MITWKTKNEDSVILSDNENLRAVLRNETLPSCSAQHFMNDLIEHSENDNGQAVSILLEDGRCEVDIYHLERMLQKRFYCHGSGSAARRTREEGHSNVSYLLHQYRVLFLRQQ